MAGGDAPDVTVLGAGIGGLAAALACARRGLSVAIVEQAPSLTEVGAGVQIAPNGLRVLSALGVDPGGIGSDAVRLVDGVTGRPIIRMPLGRGFRLLHRAALLDAFATALAGASGVTWRLGTRVAAVTEGGLRCEDGALLPVRRLIGADGARGAARDWVAPDHPRRFTGQVAWRALIPGVDVAPEATVWTGPGRHMVTYPLEGRRLNVVAVEERATWTADGWSQTDDPANLRAAFASYCPEVRALLDRVETVGLWGLMDHGAVPHWSRGTCTLIGDAAHPTLPFLAQGANMALEDAWTLVAQLDDPAAWEAARRPRVMRALAAAASNARAYHLSGPRRAAAHAALRLAGAIAPALPLRRYRWLYGADVTA